MDARESFKEALRGLEGMYLSATWDQEAWDGKGLRELLKRLEGHLEREPYPQEAALVKLYLERALELLQKAEEESLPF